MKNFKRFIYTALIALASTAVSCTNADVYEAGAPEYPDCQGVSFNVPASEMGDKTLDPTDPLVFTFKASRTLDKGNVVVPVVVVKNTDELYTVSPIEFLDGETETTFKVELDESAAIGSVYTLEINIEDPHFVSQYAAAQNTSLRLNIVRAKWIALGKVDYTEDVMTSWWGFNFAGEYAGISHPTYKVELEVREDTIDKEKFEAAMAGTGSDDGLAGTYRLKNAYRVGPWAAWFDADDEPDHYITIYAPKANEVSIPLTMLTDLDIMGIPGAAIYSMVEYYRDNGAINRVTPDMYGYIKNGEIRFPKKMLLGCPGDDKAGNNTYYANLSSMFCVNICPALNQYVLKFPDLEKGTDGDFTYAPVELPEGALFYSTAFEQSWAQTLEVGTPSVSTDDADKNFAEEYGTLYRLPDLYAEDYPVYFCVKDGRVSIPAELNIQPIGVTQLSQDLCVAIDGKKSLINLETNELELHLEVLAKDGKNYKSFGNYVEYLAVEAPEVDVPVNIDIAREFTYAKLYADTFKSGLLGDEWNQEIQKGTPNDLEAGAVFAKTYGTAYCLPSLYKAGYNIYFCADEEGNVSVPADYEVQPTGIVMFGKPIFATVVSGTVTESSATLKIQFADATGDTILGTYTEKIATFTWVDVTTATYTTLMFRNPFTDLTVQQAVGTNIYRLKDWTYEGYHFEFTWDKATNKVSLNGPQNSGVDYDDPGTLMYVCDAVGWYNDINGNDYTWEFLEKNGYPQGYYDPATLTINMNNRWAIPSQGLATPFGAETIVFDSVPGEAVVPVVGQYNITCEPAPGVSFSNNFEVVATETDNLYIVKDFGFDECETTWYGVYDAAAGTLTLDGTEDNYPDDPSAFGDLYGYWNSARTQAYGYFSEDPDNADTEGADPCVFTIDPVSKKVTALSTDFYVPVFQLSDYSVLGYAGYYEAGTPVTEGWVETSSKASKGVNRNKASFAKGNVSFVKSAINSLMTTVTVDKSMKLNTNVAVVKSDITPKLLRHEVAPAKGVKEATPVTRSRFEKASL